MSAITSAQVQYLTLAYFGRPADPASLSAWPASGLTPAAVVLRFVASDEYRLNTIVPVTSGNTLDQTGLINTYYRRLFGRNAASSEVAGWTNALATGAVNVDYLGITILNAGFNLPATTDIKQILTAKFDSAQLYTGVLFNNANSANAYNGASAIANGTAYLNTVTTSTPATFVQATAAVTALPSGGSSGQAFTLTTSQFSYTGGAGNDTFVSAGDATLVAADTIDGGLGVDTLRVSRPGSFIGGATITNIEQLNISLAAAGAGVAFSAAGISGLTLVEASGTTVTASSITNIGSAANLAISNTAIGTTFEYTTAALAGAADAVTLTLNGVTAGVFAVNAGGTSAIETLNIVSTGANTLTSLSTGAASSLVTINATGDTILPLLGSAATNLVINASASTGAVTITGFGAANQSVTGGAGADLFDFGVNLTTADTVSGGAGVDIIAANAAQFVAFTSNAANITNFETIQINDALATATAINAAFFAGVVNVRFAVAVGANLQTINGLASGANIRFDGDATTAANTVININNALATGAVDTLNIDARGAAGPVGLTAAGVELVTLNLNNSTGAKVFSLVDPNLTSFTVTNTSVNALTYAVNALSTALNTINLSGVTGAAAATSITAVAAGVGISYTGSGNNDLFVATNNLDVINAGAGNDTITGANGADLINVGSGTDNVLYTLAGQTTELLTAATLVSGTTVISATVDVITGLTAGDTLNLVGISATFAGAAANTIAGAAGIVVAIVRGDYSSTTGIWTTSATGADSIFAFDADAAVSAATATDFAILKGFTGTGTAVGGVVTLANV